MTLRVVFLSSAEKDLQDLKRYIIKKFGAKTWQASYRDIKDCIGALKLFPMAGSVPDELRNLNLTRYRQVVSGRNRIIYEVRNDSIFIHIVCDTRKDMRSLLATRLLGTR